MTNIKNWLKRNWSLVILVSIFLYWLSQNFLGVSTRNYSVSKMSLPSIGMADVSPGYQPESSYIREVAPTDSANRLVIQDTSLSLQVKSVENTIKTIENTTTSLGGFLVNSYLSKPESAASGNITVRVPEDKRAEALESFKKLSVKVVSESVFGNDVTDSYVDNDARLAILAETKRRYQEIMDKAYTVTDLMTVQRELINLQNQIDLLKGQQKYYEQSAKLSKVVIYLSTDDLSLPYSPTNEWRPVVVFKTAIRSLIGNLRSLMSLAIWLLVYSPIIVPVLFIILWLRRRRLNHV